MLIAVLTAVVTVWLALRRFYSEQWWSRKAQAYVEILSSLFKVKSYVHTRLTQNMSAFALMAADEAELLQRAREGYDELFRSAAVNVLFLPARAQALLENILPFVRNSWLPDAYEQLEPVMAAIETCISELRAIAKIDLKRDGLFWRDA